VQELTRDFFKKENDLFFVQAAGNATGTGSGAVDIEELVYAIASQRKANFTPSFGLVDPTQ